MISSIYGEHPQGWSTLLPKGKAMGRMWSDIAKNSGFFFRFLVFKFQNGRSIKILKDRWLGENTLETAFQVTIFQ